MTDFTFLKKAAEACSGLELLRFMNSHGSLYLRNNAGIVFEVRQDRSFPQYMAENRAYAEFVLDATPQAVLLLISESERDKRMLLAACMDMGAIGSALGADMNSDGEELLSMVVDMKAENKRLREFLSDISKTSGDKGAVMGARQLLSEFGQ